MDASRQSSNPGARAARAVLHIAARARRGFRSWRKARPFWAGFWTILGGALIGYVPGTGFKFVMLPGSMLWAGILVGVFIALFGLFLWIQPQLRYLLGVIIVLLSLLSFVTSDFGGLFLGMLMGITGGSLAVGWIPNAAPSRRQRRRARRLERRAHEVVLSGTPLTRPATAGALRGIDVADEPATIPVAVG